MKTFEPGEIRAHLDKITASPIFVESERLRRFLRFTVESKLLQQEDRIKEHVIGREVFDRGETYDPRLDPIVRVEARRLRAKLAEYYGGPGRADAVRFHYPKGSYLPQVVSAGAAQRTGAPSRRFLWFASILLALLVASAVFYRANAHHAMIAVVPAQWVWAEGSIDASGVALSEVLSAELADTRIARVVAWPIVAQNRDPQPVDRLAHALKASQILAVSVRNTAAGKNVAIFLLDPNTGEKLLAEQYNVPTLATSAAQHELAQRVVRDIASSGRL